MFFRKRKGNKNNNSANEKEIKQELRDELIQIFATYFSPNESFYAEPGSDKYTAYFNAINTAREEMFKNPTLFVAATGWSTEKLLDLVNNPVPGITSMKVCALLFLMGKFAVNKSALYCVDFSETIPNCIALYLLLIAQKLPVDQRTLLLDVGEGVDAKPLKEALEALKACDPNLSYRVFEY